MAEFKFKIGDVLCHRTSVELFVGLPPALFVVERYQQECPGGTQTNYLCRAVGYSSIATTLVQFNEVELAEYPRERLKRSREDEPTYSDDSVP